MPPHLRAVGMRAFKAGALLHHRCLIVGLPLVPGNNGCMIDGFCAGGRHVCVFLCVGGGVRRNNCTHPLCVGIISNSLQNSFIDSALVKLWIGMQPELAKQENPREAPVRSLRWCEYVHEVVVPSWSSSSPSSFTHYRKLR